MLKGFVLAAAAMMAAVVPQTVRAIDPEAYSWPTVTKEMRPWTRWWWLGSAVDKENITRLMEQYHGTGLGGVEICPIYGAKGYESRYLKFLSPEWMEALGWTTSEAGRLGMGVDLTTGTGWPFGGPQVSAQDASMSAVIKKNAEGKYEVVTKSPIQKVKRAAPGGEGYVVDPYSVRAMDDYVKPFDAAFAKFAGPMPGGYFHDSFEYFGANWTRDLPGEFLKRRGYDLREHLAELAGDGDADAVARVKHDYRETISDLHLAYIEEWVKWAHGHKGVARNQAHGSPSNLLDTYAAADIPETEIFGSPADQSEVMLRFASSAAHVGGHPLASSESFTWLGEHFQVSLADCKPGADLLFLSGINHVFLHGTPYSPADVAWPGWLFYAAVNFGPEGGLFHDLPAFNGYLTRCQSVLQAGRPDNDVLVYFPVHDVWQEPEGMLVPMAVHDVGKWLTPTAYGKLAGDLIGRGYAFDSISDRLLAGAKVEEGKVVVGGNAYRAVVVPQARVMPVGTMKKLAELARGGVKVIFQEVVPGDVPGWKDVEGRRGELKKAADGASFVVAGDVPGALAKAGVGREGMVEAGLRFVRREYERGRNYFIVNTSAKRVDGWVPLGTPAAGAVLLDPMGEDRIGTAAVRHRPDGMGAEVYLQLSPGESVVARTFTSGQPSGPEWKYFEQGQGAVAVEGTWRVTFVEGGPVLPKGFETKDLASWTKQEDPEAKRFAGTGRYEIAFDMPSGRASDWLLDLGKVAASARVKINGKDVGTVWCPPYCLRVGDYLKEGENKLEIEVTNLAANRIADLDRRGVEWKAFHEINFVNKNYKPFNAAEWPLRDSGLLGPVRLVPLKQFDPGSENR